MANTRYLTVEVENYVRDELAKRFGVSFSKRFLTLTTGGKHEFDAVSDDRRVVASIKATSAKTAGGNLPQGKFNNALSEIYYLSLVEAPQRMLVLTFPPFRELLVKKIDGALVDGVTIECVPLPADMQSEVDHVLSKASKEVSPAAAEAAAEAEIDP